MPASTTSSSRSRSSRLRTSSRRLFLFPFPSFVHVPFPLPRRSGPPATHLLCSVLLPSMAFAATSFKRSRKGKEHALDPDIHVHVDDDLAHRSLASRGPLSSMEASGLAIPTIRKCLKQSLNPCLSCPLFGILLHTPRRLSLELRRRSEPRPLSIGAPSSKAVWL